MYLHRHTRMLVYISLYSCSFLFSSDHSPTQSAAAVEPSRLDALIAQRTAAGELGACGQRESEREMAVEKPARPPIFHHTCMHTRIQTLCDGK